LRRISLTFPLHSLVRGQIEGKERKREREQRRRKSGEGRGRLKTNSRAQSSIAATLLFPSSYLFFPGKGEKGKRELGRFELDVISVSCFPSPAREKKKRKEKKEKGEEGKIGKADQAAELTSEGGRCISVLDLFALFYKKKKGGKEKKEGGEG